MTIREQSIRELFDECHKDAKAKGWWDTPISLWESMALIHSELSECLEDVRCGCFDETTDSDSSPPGKPVGAASELADVVIRIADTCGYHNFDLATQTYKALALGYCTDVGPDEWKRSMADALQAAMTSKQAMARIAAQRVGRIHKQLSAAQDNPTSGFGPVVYSCVCLFAILHPEGTLLDSMRRKMDYNKTRPVRHGGKLL